MIRMLAIQRTMHEFLLVLPTFIHMTISNASQISWVPSNGQAYGNLMMVHMYGYLYYCIELAVIATQLQFLLDVLSFNTFL